MITFKQFLVEGAKEDKAMEWVYDKLENSDLDIDELTAEFIKKFGKGMEKVLDKAMSNMMEATKEEKAMEWAYDKLENSDLDIDELKAEFVKKFGKGLEKILDKAMSDMMD